MKKCPYCAEEIQDEAIKCRYYDRTEEERKDGYSGGAVIERDGA